MKNIYKNTAPIFTTVIFFLFISLTALAQNGVRIAGTAGTADPSAMLDIVSTNKGVLFPRVCLASLTANSSPVTNPQAGLVIYNTGLCGISAIGLYYWNGSQWNYINTGGFSASGTQNLVARFTATNVIGTGVITDDGTNVGVGTSSPNSKLEVVNTIAHSYPTPGQTYGTLNIAPLPGASADQSASITFGAAQSVAGAQAGIYVQSSGSYGTKMYFGTTNSYATGSQIRMMIDHAGNVGIGSTTPGAKLEVDGSSGSTIKIVDGNQAAGKVLTSDANGQGSWKTAGTPAISTVVSFAYTGADQSFTVPGGVFSIQVDLYGAAGGNGSWGGWNYGWTGGAGGYTHGTVAVTPGQVLTIIVGQGGAGGATSNSTNSYGGGGHNCTSSDCQYAAKGGGRSAIRSGSTELLTAGGGGGGGSCVNIGNSLRMCGGAGGGLIGNNSINEYSGQVATGGTQTAGGTGMPGNVRTGTNGSQFTGGSPGGAESYGGGGGGGWYGGGGGNYYSNAMGGGAGGSGYISGPGVTNAWTQTGGGAQPEGAAGIGQANWPYFGRNGSVIISY